MCRTLFRPNYGFILLLLLNKTHATDFKWWDVWKLCCVELSCANNKTQHVRVCPRPPGAQMCGNLQNVTNFQNVPNGGTTWCMRARKERQFVLKINFASNISSLKYIFWQQQKRAMLPTLSNHFFLLPKIDLIS